MAEFRVIFVANDYDATVGFFTEVMGLEVERSFGEIFRGTILLAASGRIEVIEDGGGWDAPGVAGVSVSWEITDADVRARSAGRRGRRPSCGRRSCSRGVTGASRWPAPMGSGSSSSRWSRPSSN